MRQSFKATGRLDCPSCYGWIIIAVAYVTMAIGVTGRTIFTLVMPLLIDEFKWVQLSTIGTLRKALSHVRFGLGEETSTKG